jgi:phosphatidate cytidylyltransferase
MLIPRILTALVLLPLMLGAIFVFPPSAWAVFSALITGLALWEFGRIAQMKGARLAGYLLASALLAALAWRTGFHLPRAAHVLVLMFWLVLTPLWLSRRWAVPQGVRAVLLGWMLMFPAWFALLDWRPLVDRQAGLQLFAIMALVWIADVAAYFAGKAFGRRKLAPAISPGKSWEGVFGALLIVALYALALPHTGWLVLPLAGWHCLLLALPLTAVSITGDLLESWFKRCASIKDSSRLLPGHGGVYDRIDSLIAVLAVSNALRVLAGW